MNIMKMMQALQWDGKELQLNTVPVPAPDSGEVLVRLTKAGICNTDLEILRGYYPFQGTLGHEFVGVVEQAEDDTLVGKRIVSDINSSCHQCAMCDAGNPHHCLNRTALGIKGRDGAFAEFLTTPATNLVMVPDNVSDDMAVFAEPLAAALEIQEQVNFSAGDEAAVIGDGKLGLLITLSLIQAGLDVTLVGHHPERAEQLGMANFRFCSTVPDRKFPVVIEATGNPSGFADAINITAPLGTLVLKSTYEAPLNFNPAPLVVNEITLVGSRCGPMDKAVASMASGAIDPTGLIEAAYPLEKSLSAVKQANAKGTLKILVTMK
jgi:threonine dehydrogenase-like Zn-dependent dehydrogenase